MITEMNRFARDATQSLFAEIQNTALFGAARIIRGADTPKA